ncbi:MAG: hypothetical protein KDJ65_34920 [Anaerolineae bacterium]|nr:hypothetical protein [Anaerolineae bacterium]
MLNQHGRLTLAMVHRTRLNGLARQAGDDAAVAIALLKAEIEQYHWDVKQLVPLAEQVAALLREQLEAHFEQLLPEEIEAKTSPLIQELRTMAKAFDIPALHAMADYGLGRLYYLINQRDKSIKALERALPATVNVDQQLIILRLLALNWAFLGEEKLFRQAMEQGHTFIAQGDFSELHLVGLALEGFGRGQSILNDRAAFATLAQAWRIYEQEKMARQHLPLRFVQLVRSELEAMACLQEVDRQKLSTLGQRAYTMAQELGYTRYAQQIQQHLRAL